ncbi:MAG: TonB-dependent receptor [Flavipsychrobacter sp.]|nr:TonB-dependent receptor [Flavipsychrobacter sp.]
MIIRSALLFFVLLFSCSGFAQPFSITGKTIDAVDTSSLIGVNIIVSGATDTTIKTGAVTDMDGNFEVAGLNPGNYNVRIVYLGYKTISKSVTITDNNIALGTIQLKATTTELKGVTVKEKQIRAEQNGDTSSFKADGYKTNADATAEELVSKMPGVTSDNSGVKVNGETVQQVYVDGKPFFGTDPSLALKNMPAEIIDKIQVFDKLSDQSSFTGFDDGTSQKTINIVTKKNKSQGTFGKVYAGYGTDDRYIAGGNLNFFEGNRRISLIGLSNNINQQNFSAEDVLGISGGSGQNRGGGGRGGRGGGGNSGGNNFAVGQQGGITNTNSLGFNYSDNWGKKLKVTGSYFFNSTDNTTSSDITRNYFTTNDTTNTYHEYNNSETKNFNHRANLRLEYTIDSFNSIIFTPGVSFQKNNSVSNTTAFDSLGNTLSSRTSNRNTADNNGYNSSNNLLIQHKFHKPRRTISLNIGSSINEKNGTGSYFSQNNFYNPDTSSLRDQRYNLYNTGYSISPNLTYTEPVGKKGQIMANYSPSFSKNSIDKDTYDPFTPGGQDYVVLDTQYSNKYNNTYNTQKGGLSYRITDKKSTFSFGANAQYAMLNGQQQFPTARTVDKDFTNVLPMAMYNYKYDDGRNLRIMYRTNTQAPSISQLQNVVDLSNPLLLKTGNDSLKQDYEQTFIVRYGLTKAKTAKNFFLNLYVNYINDYIGNSSIIPVTPAAYDGIQVNKGSQLTRPVNLDGYWNTRSFLTYGMPVDFIKSNLNLNGGFNYTRTPGQVNFITNYSNNYTPSFGVVLSSNISEKVDFTLSYNGSYNIVNNTSQAQANNNYYNHTAAFRFNWVFAKNFVLNTNITDNYYTAFSGTGDQNFFLWNAYLGYKLLKNNALEVRISAFDILNQNKSITRTVTETYVENNVTQVLQQYFLLQLTYTLREFKGAATTGDRSGPRPEGGGPLRSGGDGPPRMN